MAAGRGWEPQGGADGAPRPLSWAQGWAVCTPGAAEAGLSLHRWEADPRAGGQGTFTCCLLN